MQTTCGGRLLNYVGGRWALEAAECSQTELVFIGVGLAPDSDRIQDALRDAEAPHAL